MPVHYRWVGSAILVRLYFLVFLLVMPSLAKAHDSEADKVRARVATVNYCADYRQKLANYTNNILWKIRKSSAEYNSEGTLDPFRANTAWHQVNDLNPIRQEPFRKSMYHNPDKAACVAYLNEWAAEIRAIGASVLPADDPVLIWKP